MDSERWKKIAELFHKASELDGDEREQFLTEACGTDADLRREVEVLLGVSKENASGIDKVVESAAADYADSLGNVEHIGPYRILGVIGQGGMGQVFLAERADQEFEREVAIKTISWITASPALIERFRLERQILANLDHPNIAHMLDGGSSDEDVPYLVMEYVAGQNIIEYCQEKSLPLKHKLDLFLQICDAVQYAHRKLVIHRDIKPSNILITADGSPKLLDFGIAKLQDADAAVTRADMRFMTQQYASPELVRGEIASTSTDIYGLGLLLYELLTGLFPYEIEGSTSLEIERLILETEPVAPSLAVASSSSRRHSLKGDLDNIVLMSLRKEADRRYQSVKDLADDVRNFLQHRPVIARTPTYRYRTGKFIYRHRLGVVAGTAAILAAITMTAFYTVQLAEQRDRAQLEATKSREVARFLTDLFKAADPRRSGGKPVTAGEMLNVGAERISEELSEQPELRAALMATIGESYHNMWDLTTARSHLRDSLASGLPALGSDHPEVIRMRYFLGMSTSFQGDFDEALPLHQENYATLVEQFGQRSIEAATELHQIAFIESKTGQFEQAEQHFLELIQVFRDSGDAGLAGLATGLMEYASMLGQLDRVEEREPMLLEALEIRRNLYGETHADYAAVINNVGNHYLKQNMLDDASRYMEENVRLNRELYGENAIPYAVALINYANLQGRYGDDQRALELTRLAEPIYRQGYGDDHPRYAYLLHNMGSNLESVGRYEEAEESFRNAVRILAEAFDTDNVNYAITQSRYGAFLLDRERFDDAIPQLEHSRRVLAQALGPTNRWTLSAGRRLGSALHNVAQSQEAIAVLTDTLRDARDSESENHQIRTLNNLAIVHRDRSEFSDADALFREALNVWDAWGPLDNPGYVNVLEEYAISLVAQQDFEAAESRLLGDYARFSDQFGSDDENVKRIAAALVALYEALGDPDKANEYRF